MCGFMGTIGGWSLHIQTSNLCGPHTRRWFVTSTIFGSTSMEQLKHDIKAFEKDLPEECMAEIQKVYKRFRCVWVRRTYCVGSKGVTHDDNLRVLLGI